MERFACVTLAALACAPAIQNATAAEPVRLSPVEVVGSTPLPRTDVPREHVPANVQTLDAATLRQSDTTTLPEAMLRYLPSVTVNEVQGNPFQLDVSYRGFSASPLLGTPQGLSVYQDGVRVNEPFGDIVNWDLIPMLAIDTVSLMPGSNPLFGLNTLGGAISLQTKSGLTSPGSELALSGGSFGRRKLDVAHGARWDSMHAFVAFTGLEEDGWRDFSPSRLRNAFAKVGQRLGSVEWDLATTYGRTNLTGNGLLPEPLLAQRREQAYTRPDVTRNEMGMAALNASYSLSGQSRVSGLLYARSSRARTVNGDVNPAFDDPPDLPAVENRTLTRQRAYGAALQWSQLGPRSNFTIGLSYDRARSRFERSELDGVFDSARLAIPTETAQRTAQLRGRTHTSSVYFTETYALFQNLQLTLSTRYNVTRVETIDELGGIASNLNGDFTYRKLNPALGLTWQAAPALSLYGGWSQGNRAPSPIELGCADPIQPCTLPNALQSDPFLKQVVARTVELGVRGRSEGTLRWNAGAFRTASADDILFVGTSASAGRGFFQNFGRTRRQGMELGLSGHAAGLDWHGSYSYVRATFESSACVVSPSNSAAGESARCAAEQIEVSPGDRIPGIPLHSLKLNVLSHPYDRLTVGSTLSAFSSQYVRGNENNAHRPDGTSFSGSGKLSGYALLDLYASYDLGGSWQLFAKVTNVFDRDYASAGQLARSSFDAQGRFIPDADEWRNQQFAGPGAPRAGWIGVRYRTRAR